MTLDAPASHLAVIKKILAEHVPGYNVRAFGSRVTGKTKPASDLDLVIMTRQPLPAIKMARLKDAFNESNIPFKIDIVDWSELSSDFQKIISASSQTL